TRGAARALPGIRDRDHAAAELWRRTHPRDAEHADRGRRGCPGSVRRGPRASAGRDHAARLRRPGGVSGRSRFRAGAGGAAHIAARPGVPNIYGLVGGEANSIAPFKTPLSSMSPTIVTLGRQPVLVVGSPGGSVIITATLQTMLNVIDFQMPLPEAVAAPRI